MTKAKQRQIEAAAIELYDACGSILQTCEEMQLGDIGALDDVRAALRAAGDKVEEYNER